MKNARSLGNPTCPEVERRPHWYDRDGHARCQARNEIILPRCAQTDPHNVSARRGDPLGETLEVIVVDVVERWGLDSRNGESWDPKRQALGHR